MQQIFRKKKLLFVFSIIVLNLQINNNLYAFQSTNDYNPSLSPDGSKIVFNTDRHGSESIYISDLNGSNQKRLTFSTSSNGDFAPSWSPDGSKIAFHSQRTGIYQIYTMNPDGSDQVPLTESYSDDTLPSWSSDGSKIYFSSRRTGVTQIWKMDKDGSRKSQVSFSKGEKFGPVISPDGSKILYNSPFTGGTELYIVNSNGSGQTRLTNAVPPSTGTRILGYNWIDNGKRILISTNFGIINSMRNIYTMKIDGSDIKKLSNEFVDYNNPVMSPDEKTIFFDTERNGGNEIYSMDLNGNYLLNITKTSSKNRVPNWAKNGSKIIFESQRDGNYEIYIMNSDGSNPVNLTKSKGEELAPKVSFDSKKIVYRRADFVTHNDIFIMDISGNNAKSISKDNIFRKLKVFPVNPTFTPKGDKIVVDIFNTEGTISDIYIINADGKNITNLTHNSAGEIDRNPRVSPDGKYIIYTTRIGGNWEIFRMNIDGTDPVNLSNENTQEFYPSWSSDSEKIYFTSYGSQGDRNIYIMDKDGNNVKKITNDIGNNWYASISPDGKKILVDSTSDLNYEIYTIDINGRNKTNLTSKHKSNQ